MINPAKTIIGKKAAKANGPVVLQVLPSLVTGGAERGAIDIAAALAAAGGTPLIASEGCGACEPVCPVTAIFPEEELPDKWNEYIAINTDYFA